MKPKFSVFVLIFFTAWSHIAFAASSEFDHVFGIGTAHPDFNGAGNGGGLVYGKGTKLAIGGSITPSSSPQDIGYGATLAWSKQTFGLAASFSGSTTDNDYSLSATTGFELKSAKMAFGARFITSVPTFSSLTLQPGILINPPQ